MMIKDLNSGGPSSFFQSKTNWGFSSTGHYLDLDYSQYSESYNRATSSSISGQNSQLYTDARLCPLSLTYYGFCLMNGNYTVNLHFAEIMFTDDRTYRSLGRRIFDVYIQGMRVLKAFNIENEAGGVNKAVIRNFTAVVTDNMLDIRFYWAGKGTTGIPERVVYGPLISAISVEPDFTPLSENGSSISAGAIVGIVIAVLFAVFLVLGILWWMGCLRRKDSMRHDLKGLDLHTGSFTLRQIEAATNNFDPANKIGEGGFGPVYKANSLKVKGNLLELVDPRLESKFNKEEITTAINVAFLCTNGVAAERPSMSAVVSMLEGRAGVQEFVSDSSVSVERMNPKEMGMTEHDGEGQDTSIDTPLTTSSESTADLYQSSWIPITGRREINTS